MKEKGVVQVEEVFAPVIFFGHTMDTQNEMRDLMTDPSAPVYLSYNPSMVKQEALIRILMDNIHVFALKDGAALYAPLYEAMDQVISWLYYW